MEKLICDISINGRPFKGSFGCHDVDDRTVYDVNPYTPDSFRMREDKFIIHPGSKEDTVRLLDLLAHYGKLTKENQHGYLSIKGSYKSHKRTTFEAEAFINSYDMEYKDGKPLPSDMTLELVAKNVQTTTVPPNFEEQVEVAYLEFYRKTGNVPNYIILSPIGYKTMLKELPYMIEKEGAKVKQYKGFDIVTIDYKGKETEDKLYIEFGY